MNFVGVLEEIVACYREREAFIYRDAASGELSSVSFEGFWSSVSRAATYWTEKRKALPQDEPFRVGIAADNSYPYFVEYLGVIAAGGVFVPLNQSFGAERVLEFAAEIGMIPLELHKEQPGYILNSMLVPFLSSAEMLWANEVADPETIDKTWKLGTGSPLGPFQILDIVGLQTAYNIVSMNPESKNPESTPGKIAAGLKAKIDAGKTGINAGEGFYRYEK